MATSTESTDRVRLPVEKKPAKKRPAWRQRLVDAERGMTAGFRGDSIFFVHFFTASVVIATAFALGFETIYWTILIIALTVMLSAEMFHQVLKTILKQFGHHFSDDVQRAVRIGSAAVFVTILGAVLTIGLLIGERLSQLFSG